MSKINSGIVLSEPLTEEQLNDARKRVLETGEAIACIDHNKELCFLLPTSPQGIKELAWNHAEEIALSSPDSTTVMKYLYKKSDTNAHFLEQEYYSNNFNTTTPTFNVKPASPRWVNGATASAGKYTINSCDNADLPDSGVCYIPAYIAGTPVTALSDGLFANCDKLTYVNIPPTVTSVDYGLFRDATNLVEVDLGNCETSNLANAFVVTPKSLRTISVANNNQRYASIDGVLFDSTKTQLIKWPPAYADTYTCPTGTTKIEHHAFHDCYSIPVVTIPNSVTSIGPYAFSSGVGSLEYLGTAQQWAAISKTNGANGWYNGTSTSIYCTDAILNYKVTGIDTASYTSILLSEYFGYEISSGTINIVAHNPHAATAEIRIPSTLNGLTVVKIADYAFANNTSMTSVIVPSSVKTIGYHAFENCTSLTGVSLANGIKNIEEAAFKNCSSLIGISIPTSVTNINSLAFDGCTSLKGFTVSTGNTIYTVLNNNLVSKDKTMLIKYAPASPSQTVSLPSYITKIAEFAFKDNVNLGSVSLPTSITSIGRGAFANCSKLKRINYLGTTQQWAAIELAAGWNSGLAITAVVCKDGTVTL